jgi:hypothetical protein
MEFSMGLRGSIGEYRLLQVRQLGRWACCSELSLGSPTASAVAVQ